MYNRYMVITNNTGNINTTTVVSPKSIKNPKPPKNDVSPRKRSPRRHKKNSILYLPKDEEELFKHLYPHFVSDSGDTTNTTNTTDNTNTPGSTDTETTVDEDEELVRTLFPWLLEN